jgi:hypothetical protein
MAAPGAAGVTSPPMDTTTTGGAAPVRRLLSLLGRGTAPRPSHRRRAGDRPAFEPLEGRALFSAAGADALGAAGASRAAVTDGTSNTIMIAENHTAAGTYALPNSFQIIAAGR